MPKPKNPLALKLSLPNSHINESAPPRATETHSSTNSTPFTSQLKLSTKLARPPLPYQANEISPSTLLALRHQCHKLILEAEHYCPSNPPPQLPLLSPPRSPAPSTPSLSPCSSTPEDVEGNGRKMSTSSIISPILSMPEKPHHKASAMFQKPMVAAYSFAKAATQSKLSEAASLAKYRMYNSRKDAPPVPTRQPSSDSAKTNKVDLVGTKAVEPQVVDLGTGEIKTTELFLNAPINDSTDLLVSPIPIPKDATSIPLRTAKRRPTLITITTSVPNSAAKTKETPISPPPPHPTEPPPPVPVLVTSPEQYHPGPPPSVPATSQTTTAQTRPFAAAYSIFPHSSPPRPSTAISHPTSGSVKNTVPPPLPLTNLYTTVNPSQIGLAIGSPSQPPHHTISPTSTPSPFSNTTPFTNPNYTPSNPTPTRTDPQPRPSFSRLLDLKKSKSSHNLRASIDRPLPPLPIPTTNSNSNSSPFPIHTATGPDGRNNSITALSPESAKRRWWTGLREGLQSGQIEGGRGDIGMPEVHLRMPEVHLRMPEVGSGVREVFRGGWRWRK